MNRRQLVLGLGGLAAGVGAATGTGAFTSTSADRSISAEIVADEDAYLAVEEGNLTGAHEFFEETGTPRKAGLQFNSVDSGAGGPGSDSTYEFDSLISVRNQGTQDVYFYVEVGEFEARDSGETVDGDERVEMEFYADGDRATVLDGSDGVVDLDVGDPVDIGVRLDTDDAPAKDQEATVTLVATEEQPSGTTVVTQS